MSLKREIKKVSKLINESGYIPVLDDNKIIMIVDKLTGKTYEPKNELVIL